MRAWAPLTLELPVSDHKSTSLSGPGGDEGRAGGVQARPVFSCPQRSLLPLSCEEAWPLGSMAASLWAAAAPQRCSPGASGWLCPLPKIADLPLTEQDGNLKIPGATSAALREGVTGSRLVLMPSIMIKLDKIGELRRFRCYAAVQAGLWFPRGDRGSRGHSVFLLGGISKRRFQGGSPCSVPSSC